MKITIEKSLLANCLAMLSHQQGYINGIGSALDKKLNCMEEFLGDLHTDILREFEKSEEHPQDKAIRVMTDDAMMEKIEKLEAENARYREALQVYADDDVIGTVARKALKEME